MLSYPLHPAGGISGCNAQEGEAGEGQRELPEGHRGESTRAPVFFRVVQRYLLLFPLHIVVFLGCMSNRPPVNQSMWAGLGCLKFFLWWSCLILFRNGDSHGSE